MEPTLTDEFEWVRTGERKHFSDVREAEEYFSELFAPHGLQSLRPRTAVRIDARVRRFQGCGLLTLEYGSAVRITPDRLGDVLLVQIPLSGQSRMRVGTEEIVATPMLATLPPADQPAVIRWSEDSPHLILLFPRLLVEQTAAKLYGVTSAAGLTVGRSLDLSHPNGRRFMQALQEFDKDLSAADTAVAETMARTSLELVIMRFLEAVDHSLSPRTDDVAEEAGEGESANNALAHRYVKLLRTHAHEDAQIADYAERLGVSTRTLQMATASAFQRSPRKLLIMERLRSARLALTDPEQSSLTIAEVANSCGFNHLSRFSSAYRRRFGESPRETRNRAPFL